MYLPMDSGNSIRTVFASSSEATIYKANGSLPTNSNLCGPPGMAPQGPIVSRAACLSLDIAQAK